MEIVTSLPVPTNSYHSPPVASNDCTRTMHHFVNVGALSCRKEGLATSQLKCSGHPSLTCTPWPQLPSFGRLRVVIAKRFVRASQNFKGRTRHRRPHLQAIECAIVVLSGYKQFPSSPCKWGRSCTPEHLYNHKSRQSHTPSSSSSKRHPPSQSRQKKSGNAHEPSSMVASEL